MIDKRSRLRFLPLIADIFKSPLGGKDMYVSTIVAVAALSTWCQFLLLLNNNFYLQLLSNFSVLKAMLDILCDLQQWRLVGVTQQTFG